jgi:hypothetical protein
MAGGGVKMATDLVGRLRQQSGYLADASSPHPVGPISRETCGGIKDVLSEAANRIELLRKLCATTGAVICAFLESCTPSSDNYVGGVHRLRMESAASELEAAGRGEGEGMIGESGGVMR